ncbi:MAG: hypothetical protein ABEL76_02750 [Bradymonadaceae bacterium]
MEQSTGDHDTATAADASGRSDGASDSTDGTDTADAGSACRMPDGGPSSSLLAFDGGCFAISEATVDDTCLSESVTIPEGPPPPDVLGAINRARREAGRPELSNPVDLSAAFEKDMAALLESTPSFPLDPISCQNLKDGELSTTVPNPYNAGKGSSGIEASCSVQGNTGTCSLDEIEVDLLELAIRVVAGQSVSIPDRFSCVAVLGGTVEVTWVGPEEVRYRQTWDVRLKDSACNRAAEAFLPKTSCRQVYTETATRQGPLGEPPEVCR